MAELIREIEFAGMAAVLMHSPRGYSVRTSQGDIWRLAEVDGLVLDIHGEFEDRMLYRAILLHGPGYSQPRVVHYGSPAVCGQTTDGRAGPVHRLTGSADPVAVTCRKCRRWLRQH